MPIESVEEQFENLIGILEEITSIIYFSWKAMLEQPHSAIQVIELSFSTCNQICLLEKRISSVHKFFEQSRTTRFSSTFL